MASIRRHAKNALAAYGAGIIIFASAYGLASCNGPAHAETLDASQSVTCVRDYPAAVLERALAKTSSQGLDDVSKPAEQTCTADISTDNSKSQKDSSLTIGGAAIPYVYSIGVDIAPISGAGLWWGSDSCTDGRMGYFVGHNPGDFSGVAKLQRGDVVQVTDHAGNTGSYQVTDIFDVSQSSGLCAEDMTIVDIATGKEYALPMHTEAIALQTCSGDAYRIVIAHG